MANAMLSNCNAVQCVAVWGEVGAVSVVVAVVVDGLSFVFDAMMAISNWVSEASRKDCRTIISSPNKVPTVTLIMHRCSVECHSPVVSSPAHFCVLDASELVSVDSKTCQT